MSVSKNNPSVVMTIAGSDSGAGAGLQADLKTFTALGVWGTTVVTCLTAQNPAEVTGVQPVAPAFVRRQIAAVCSGFAVKAVKTGMLYDAGIIRAVAREMKARQLTRLVVDPVMVATSGARLLRRDAVRALCDNLLPLAALITPNVPEAEVLAGITIDGPDQQVKAAGMIAAKFGAACVVKGGHLPGKTCAEVLCAGRRTYVYRQRRIMTRHTHGTGCAFSAAVTAFLARGFDLPRSVGGAQKFVREMLRDNALRD